MLKLFKRKTAAEKARERYLKWLKSYTPKDSSQTIELLHVFTDRLGNNYYVIKDISRMRRERQIRIEESLMAIEYGVSKTKITERLEEINSEFDKFNFRQPNPANLVKFQDRTKNLIGDLLHRMNKINPEDLMLKAALYFIYIDGENPYTISAEDNQRKWENCQTDPELRAFFLETLEYILIHWGNGKGQHSR